MIIIFLLLSINVFAQFSDTTNVIVLRFNEPMDAIGLTEKSKYSLKDTVGNEYKIYDVKIVTKVGDENIIDTSCVAVISQRLPYRRFVIKVDSVKDKAGNMIRDKNLVEFSFIGKKDLEKPQINLRRK